MDLQTRFVMRAFQMHFQPEGSDGLPDLETVSVLFALLEKYHPEKLGKILATEPH